MRMSFIFLSFICLTQRANNLGVESLRIEGTFGEQRLVDVLQRAYNATVTAAGSRSGYKDAITIIISECMK